MVFGYGENAHDLNVSDVFHVFHLSNAANSLYYKWPGDSEYMFVFQCFPLDLLIEKHHYLHHSTNLMNHTSSVLSSKFIFLLQSEVHIPECTTLAIIIIPCIFLLAFVRDFLSSGGMVSVFFPSTCRLILVLAKLMRRFEKRPLSTSVQSLCDIGVVSPFKC